MAKTGAIKAGRAFVEIGADTNPLVKGLKRSTAMLNSYASRVTGFGKQMLAYGSALLAPIGAAVFSFMKTGDELNKMAARTGATTEALSEMGFAAEQSGFGLQTLETGIKGMQKFTLNAERGLSTAKDTLDDLGVSVQDFAGLSPEKQFELFADRISQIEDPGRRAALAMQVFGRAGQQMMPLLNGGAAAIRELREEARGLGLTVTADEAQAAADAADAWNRIKNTFKATGKSVAVALLPTLTELSKLVLENSQVMLEWIRGNRWAVLAVAGTGAALITMAGAALGVGVALKIAAIATGLLTTVVGAVLSPVGLLVGGLAAVVYYSGIGGKAIDWLTSRFGFLGEFAQETFGYLKAALNAGEFKLAAEFLWASIKVAWFKGTKELNEKITEWSDYFKNTWSDATTEAAVFFIDSWADLQKAWVETTRFISDAWDVAIGSMKSVWLSFYEQAIKGQLDLEFGIDPKEGSSMELAKIAAESLLETRVAGLKEASQNATGKKIGDREKSANAELDRIKDIRKDAVDQIKQDAKDKSAEQVLQNLTKKLGRNDALTRAILEREKLRLQIENKGLLLPDVKDTALGKSAESGGEDIKNTPGFQATNTGGGGPVNLRSQEGAKLIADLLNRSQEDEMLDVLKDGNGLQVAMIEAIKALNRPLSLEG